MKLQFLRSLDFNQMLVTSVFVHLFFMTVVLFLPKMQMEEDIVVPALMVQLVDMPTGQKKPQEKPKVKQSAPKKPKQVARKAQPVKPPPAVKKAESKPVVVQPPTPELKFSPMVIPKLDAAIEPVDPGKTKDILQELAELAQLPPTKATPIEPEKKKSKPVLEETFKEEETIKQRKLPPKKREMAPAVVENPMKKFEQLQMQENLEDKPVVKKTVEATKKKNLFDELEFASLDRNPIKTEKTNKKSTADLLKELSKLNELETVTPPQINSVTPEELLVPEKTSAPKTFAPILEKLASLDIQPMEISIDVDTNRAIAKDFESGVWKVKVPDVVNPDTQESPSFVFSELEGPPGADVLSLYIGNIREKVYKKWGDLLAQMHDKEAVVSFYLFPNGNIDKPILKKSSGVEQLDSLAIRAILDSEPFSKFPKELKFSNLNIIINFKYVPEK